MSDLLTSISTAVIRGDVGSVSRLTQLALSQGIGPREILEQGLIKGMDFVGAEFRDGRMFIPEVLFSARAMQQSMDTLRPLLTLMGAPMAGKVVIGTVLGDIHDIGKNLVRMMLEGAGFEVIDLGRSVEPQRFVEAVRNDQPQILALSSLLTTTMGAMAATIQQLEAESLRPGVSVLVGGAPVTPEFARSIGADGYGANAMVAVDLARELVAKAQTGPRASNDSTA
jgi:5-methyltetrahydrofolate--homocysteine methyltransferase